MALVAAELAASGPVFATAELPQPLVLNLRLTPASTLPDLSRRALVSEAEAIWRQGRVHLRWLDSRDTVPPGATLRVLVTPNAVSAAHVTPNAVSAAHDTSSWPVGELLRFDGSVAIAVASIAGARRIVDLSGHALPAESTEMRDYRVGLVLGRAIAHEIGHFILQTNTHAPSGLMRGTIEAREFADLRTNAFQLDRAALAHVSAFAQDPSRLLLPDRPFSYRRYPSRRGPD